MRHVVVFSGPLRVGKSTVCAEVLARVRRAGLHTAGVLAPPEIVEGEKVGIWLEDADSRERRHLAVAAHLAAEGEIKTEHWTFNAEVMAWGAETIARACPCDVLVIDELGPLELERGEGWVAALDVLRAGAYRWALAPVREWLVDALLNRLHGAEDMEALVVPVSHTNRVALPGKIAAKILDT